MTLVVETGEGLSNAESYISVADADSYHANRANTAWAALSTPNKEAYLRRATDYMVQSYRQKWKGVRMTATQALDWPRAEVYAEPALYGAVGDFPYLVPNDIVPTEVARACAELGLKAISGELAPDQTQQKKSVKVDVIETEFFESASNHKKYRAVDNMLAPYLAGSDLNMKVVRA